MSNGWLRAFEHLHGHLGWLSTLALYHPAILLRRPRRRAVFAAIAATVLVTLTGAMGALIYPAYRQTLKPAILAAAPIIGELFERKEHLGVAAVILAWTGTAFHVGARWEPLELRTSRVAFVAFVGAAVLATLAASMGSIVAVTRTF
jgi:hypothetical protein